MKRTIIDKCRALNEASTIPQVVYDVARLERLLGKARSDMYHVLRKYWTREELRQAGITIPRGEVGREWVQGGGS